MKYDFHNKQFAETGITPDKLAIAGSDGDISWNTLRSKTEQFSSELKKLQIPIGHPIIIYGHKECFFPVAILACIHSTVTYIPIDRIYPLERIKKIMEITGAQILINCSDVKLSLDQSIDIDREMNIKINHAPDYSGKIYGTTEDPLQYIMFTSGSTGEPKGVQITKTASLAFTDWLINDYGYSPDEVFVNQAPFSFDLSLYELMSNYAIGGSLILNAEEVFKEQEMFLKRVSDYKCTTWISTPSFAFLHLRNPSFNGDKLPHLKTFLFIGEELPNRTAAVLKTNFKTTRVLNAYGPTEATVATTLIEITDDIVKAHSSLPIGYPMPGSEIFIEKINAEDKEGEIVIAGDHVSIGYLKNPELNEKKFFVHKGKRAFKTGDLGYYENGILFFIGRNDDQVKMHGFRIELNEISSMICKNEFITEAVTVPLKRNNEVKKIVSFVKLNTEVDMSKLKETLIAFLKESLPYYMIPGDIVAIDEFPFNNNHKIDRQKLIEDYIFQQTNS